MSEAHGPITLHHGDCLDVLKTLPDASVDAVVTDPPYGLSFMGKAWDKPTPRPEACRECGNDDPTEGYLVCSDCLEELGHDGDQYAVPEAPAHGGRSMLGHVSANWHDKGTHSRGYADNDNAAFQAWCQQWAVECLRVLKPGGHMLAFGGTRTWHRLACAVEDAGFEVRDSLAWLYGSGFPKSLDVSRAIDKAAGASREPVRVDASQVRNPKATGGGRDGTEGATRPWIEAALANGYHEKPGDTPATAEAAAWSGWGTALKPGFEPMVVARKPLTGTVAANVLQNGTGALNIDACRIEGAFTSGWSESGSKAGPNDSMSGPNYARDPKPDNPAGRWPANVVLDQSQAAALDQQSGERPAGGKVTGRQAAKTGDSGIYGAFGAIENSPYDDTGGASRFFYVAKADSSERVRVDGTAHPTVKPLDLMRWLVRLVTPPGGTVLEPFAGSGTTAEACLLEGFHCIAIEREADYLPLIRQRLNRRRDPVAAVRATGDDGGLFDLLGEGA